MDARLERLLDRIQRGDPVGAISEFWRMDGAIALAAKLAARNANLPALRRLLPLAVLNCREILAIVQDAIWCGEDDVLRVLAASYPFRAAYMTLGRSVVGAADPDTITMMCDSRPRIKIPPFAPTAIGPPARAVARAAKDAAWLATVAPDDMTALTALALWAERVLA